MAASVTRWPWKGLLRVLFLILLILAANHLVALLVTWLEFDIRPNNEDMVHRMIMMTAALYAGLIAIPFVPGVEVGLALISVLGPPIVALVYGCTLAGLTLSFLVGRLLPLSAVIWCMDQVHFRRASDLLRGVEPLDGRARLEFLLSRAPSRYLPFLLRHRYIALALAINMPGNFLIGGGGGIALVAGLSRLFPLPAYLATIAVAVAPVPLLVFFFGADFLTR